MENLLILSAEYKEQLEIGDELERLQKKAMEEIICKNIINIMRVW